MCYKFLSIDFAAHWIRDRWLRNYTSPTEHSEKSEHLPKTPRYYQITPDIIIHVFLLSTNYFLPSTSNVITNQNSFLYEVKSLAQEQTRNQKKYEISFQELISNCLRALWGRADLEAKSTVACTLG